MKKNKPLFILMIVGIAIITNSILLFVACGLSNLTNIVYYNNFSDGETNITSSSYNDGYISRWERLDYTKKNTQEEKFNLNVWRFNSEYSVHMYSWFILKPFYTGDYSDSFFAKLAYRAQSAEIDANLWDPNWYVQVAGIIMGIFGI